MASSQAKYCFFVVLLCIITPILVGYAWPESEGTQSLYLTENRKNITPDLAISDIDYYTELTDIYTNNSKIYVDDTGTSFVNANNFVADTLNNTGVPAWGYFTTTQSVGYLDSSGNLEIQIYTTLDNLAALIESGSNEHPTKLVVTFPGTITAEYLGNEIRALVGYPDSGAVYVIADDNSVIAVPYEIYDPVLDLSGSAYSNVLPNIQWFFGANYFVDTSKGYQLQQLPGNKEYVWYNGYTNSQIDIVYETYDDFFVMLKFPRNGGQVSIAVSDSDEIELNAGGSTQSLGTIDQYPYIVLRVDVDRQSVSLSGLPAMTKFTDPYLDRMMNTITANLFLEDFSYIKMRSIMSTDLHYMVTRTMSSLAMVNGINDLEMNTRSYIYGDFQIDIQGVQLAPIDQYRSSTWPGSIRFGNANVMAEGRINADRTIDWYNNGSLDIDNAPMKTTIQYIGNDLFINGIRFGNGGLDDVKLYLYGSWIAQVYMSDIVTETIPDYGWSAGGFGLDDDGFCIVGLITSVMSGLACMLAGKRSGNKATLVLITSMMCGFVYLLILMDGF